MKKCALNVYWSMVLSAVACAVSWNIYAKGPGVSTPHNQVQRLTTGATLDHQRYAPKLYIEHGCQPFAAVDDQGNYNAGLKDSGGHNAKCSASSTGQAYARSLCKSGFCGYMYVYYMPKDNGFPFPFLGHRHDFEEIVIWTKDGEMIGAAYSAHGDYNYHTDPYRSEGRINAAYGIDGVTHSMKKIKNADRDKGTVWPVASWDKMTPQARQALNDVSNFPSSVFAARDDNFIDKLNEARIAGVNVVFER